jgi:hypothetical protein
MNVSSSVAAIGRMDTTISTMSFTSTLATRQLQGRQTRPTYFRASGPNINRYRLMPYLRKLRPNLTTKRLAKKLGFRKIATWNVSTHALQTTLPIPRSVSLNADASTKTLTDSVQNGLKNGTTTVLTMLMLNTMLPKPNLRCQSISTKVMSKNREPTIECLQLQSLST